MNTKKWDRDIEKSVLSDERFINEELKQHMYHLWSLSDGRIGERPPYNPDIKTNLMSGKIEGRKNEK